MTIRGLLAVCLVAFGAAGCINPLAADLDWTTDGAGCGGGCAGDHVLGSRCVGGVCLGECAPGFADCNGNLQDDGCEVDTIHATETGSLALVPVGCRVRCGAGPDCGGGQICREGACVCDRGGCNGCCQGARCIAEEDRHCGRGGAACIDCTQGAPFAVSDFCADGTCHCSGPASSRDFDLTCVPGTECLPGAGCRCTTESCSGGCGSDGSCLGGAVEGRPLPSP